jgi:hypothetical protein
MKLIFTTKNGSVYFLDKEAMTWKRRVREGSGVLRAESGKLIAWPEIKLDESGAMFDDAVMPGAIAHCVRTSRVVSIWGTV